VAKLNAEEYRQFRQWLADHEYKNSEHPLASDVASGKFDRVREKIRAEYDSGRCTDL
jgi:hypothetical protein